MNEGKVFVTDRQTDREIVRQTGQIFFYFPKVLGGGIKEGDTTFSNQIATKAYEDKLAF